MPTPGNVYILKNLRISSLVKVGKTNNLDRRLIEINSHADVGGRWEVAGYVIADDMDALETATHKKLFECHDRQSGGREMFECCADTAGIAILHAAKAANIEIFKDMLPNTIQAALVKQRNEAARVEQEKQVQLRENERQERVRTELEQEKLGLELKEKQLQLQKEQHYLLAKKVNQLRQLQKDKQKNEQKNRYEKYAIDRIERARQFQLQKVEPLKRYQILHENEIWVLHFKARVSGLVKEIEKRDRRRLSFDSRCDLSDEWQSLYDRGVHVFGEQKLNELLAAAIATEKSALPYSEIAEKSALTPLEKPKPKHWYSWN